MKRLITINQILTFFFVVSASLSAILFNATTRGYIVGVSLALFAVGIATFLLGYFAAVQRSREEEISVTQLFFMTGGVAPRDVKWKMLGCFYVQAVVGLAAALSRPTTDGKSGSVLAFCVMVPMLGIGMNGLWVSRWGAFEPRRLRDQVGAEVGAEVDAEKDEDSDQGER